MKEISEETAITLEKILMRMNIQALQSPVTMDDGIDIMNLTERVVESNILSLSIMLRAYYWEYKDYKQPKWYRLAWYRHYLYGRYMGTAREYIKLAKKYKKLKIENQEKRVEYRQMAKGNEEKRQELIKEYEERFNEKYE